jgi:hypothetical protein
MKDAENSKITINLMRQNHERGIFLIEKNYLDSVRGCEEIAKVYLIVKYWNGFIRGFNGNIHITPSDPTKNKELKDFKFQNMPGAYDKWIALLDCINAAIEYGKKDIERWEKILFGDGGNYDTFDNDRI